MSFRPLPTVLSVSTLVLASATMLLSGCSVMNSVEAPTSSALPAVQGNVMGGETGILGAHVILWQTDPSNSGYGTSGAVKLATATTTANGAFSFATGYSCATGQFVYITATGGDVSNGGNIINNNEVQMAALGSCSNFSNATKQASVVINVNEVSTVAAAYALNNFMTVVPSSTGNQLVYIGAPANNNAATGSCTGTGSAMTCVAAGLAHAFANAMNLTDSVHFDGSVPTGLALTAIPGNATGSVPQAEIHTLANILQTCTNSAGGTAGDGSTCGQLFTVVTPTSATAPTDELSALLYITRNPKHNVTSSTCASPGTTIFCLAPGTGAAFQPTLAAAPSDWSLAITYSGVVVGTTSNAITFPQALALDANDNVYIATSSASAGAGNGGLVAMSSSGTGLWANAPTALECYPGGLATDTVGQVWLANGPTSAQATGTGCWQNLISYSQATGASVTTFSPSAAINGSPVAATGTGIQGQALVVAVDNLNDVWWARKATSCTNCLFEVPYTGGTPATYGVQVNIQNAMVQLTQLLFDSSNNLYVSSSSATSAYLLKNTGTTNAPTYAAGPTGYSSLAPTAAGTGLGALDASNDWWVGIGGKLNEFTGPVAAGATPTSFTVTSTVSTSTSPTKPTIGEVDGAGTLWYPSSTSSGQIWFTQLATNTSDYFYTCYAAAGATSCAATATTTATPKQVQIDSTGALWLPSTTTNYVVQVLGPGAPAWPQLSYAHYGVKPQ